MAKQVQIRRGTTSENDSFTGAVGELTADTTKNEFRLHDGSTPGGKVVGQEFSAGFRMLAQQSSAPVGWAKVTAHNDKALRVVSGNVVNGGNQAFTTVFGAGKTTANHVLTQSQMPAHVHTPRGAIGGDQTSAPVGRLIQFGSNATQEVGVNDAADTTTITGGGAAHLHSLTMDPLFVDVIIIQKD